MGRGRKQAEDAIRRTGREKSDANLACRISGPFHSQGDRIALADDRGNPGVPAAIVEQMQRRHRDESLTRIGQFGALCTEELRAEHDKIKSSQNDSAEYRQVVFSEAPPDELPVRCDRDPVLDYRAGFDDRLRHQFSIRMRGSISANKTSDSKVPTMV